MNFHSDPQSANLEIQESETYPQSHPISIIKRYSEVQEQYRPFRGAQWVRIPGKNIYKDGPDIKQKTLKIKGLGLL